MTAYHALVEERWASNLDEYASERTMRSDIELFPALCTFDIPVHSCSNHHHVSDKVGIAPRILIYRLAGR